MALTNKLTAIADAIREKTGGTDALTLDGMATGIAEVYEAGESAERAKCVAKHFVTTILGNGETSIRFHVPFEPDFLSVFCNDPDIYGAASPTVCCVYFDICSFGLLAAERYIGVSTGVHSAVMSSESYKSRYSRAEDGIVTIGNLASSAGTGVFKVNRPYTVCAVKYVEQTDKERITEYIRSLGDSGSTTINQSKVEAAFTDEEWAALIAEKPGWTFSFV